MRRSITIAVLAAVLLATAPAYAESPVIRHRVAEGDTLELLAAEYYGDRRHAVFILVANEMTHPRPLRKGEVLRIPMNRSITANDGDSLESLAKQHLGDERRAPFLAEFNNIQESAPIAVGQHIVVPLTVSHRAAGKEKLTSIAAAYFGDSKKADLLQRYNFLSADFIDKGKTIIIPINHVRVQASKLPPPDEESSARLRKRADMVERAIDVLPRVEQAWQQGNYSAVRRDLAGIETEYLDIDVALEVGVLLGAAHLAFGDEDLALVSFRKVLERKDKHPISAYTYSPKVREVWRRAGGAVED